MVAPHRFTPPPSYAGVRSLLDLEQTVVLDELALQQALDDLPPEVPESPEDGPGAGRDAGPDAGPDDLGSRVARRFFTLCENPRTRARTMKVLRSSADSAVGGRLLVAFLSRMVFTPLMRSRRVDHVTARVELACAQLGGVAVLRYVTRMEPVASMDVEDLVAMVGPSVHLTLTSPYAR
ncbi:TetR/AcrR family transcriptional regulator [Nocardioides marmoribigeumensis]|jgi:hypothetical protein|uniref:Tetracyclin repressor-like C-terminal domain-containing protein n=1 Tax=Nocardioides marmoribigeumensis TaxID=433649 RepID=A0ABU2BWL7_9ACTN|nr:hypothetical protein [Nocardioides marmoribigeumensis]MDR7362293.1 hypothetical protein [Nocardioides marmoribigeumensis]